MVINVKKLLSPALSPEVIPLGFVRIPHFIPLGFIKILPFIPLGFVKIQSIFLSVLSKNGEKTWKYHHIALSLPAES